MNTLPILFENNEILIINKRAGLAVQGGEKVSHSVDELLAKQIGQKVFPVHRLDKDTSGILVVAKSSAAAGKWTQLIASGAVKKQYTAFCLGIPGGFSIKDAVGKKGIFDSDVGNGKDKRNAHTEYKIKAVEMFSAEKLETEVETFDPFPISLLELTLGTGRTHQIRIHLAQNGCPIIADDKYGNFKTNKILRKYAKIKILQLAATKLTLPLDGKNVTFEVEMPSHMGFPLNPNPHI